MVRDKKAKGKKGRGGEIKVNEGRQQDDISELLRHRGRNMTEDRVRKNIDIKITLYKQNKEKSLSIRSKLMELLRRCQEADETAMVVNGQKVYQQGKELPVGADFITAFAAYQDRNGRVGMHALIRTKRSLRELK